MADFPKFKSDEEAVLWFDTHDTSDYIENMEVLEKDFEVIHTTFTTQPLDVRVRTDHLAVIQEIANRKGIPYQMLVQSWLLERLTQEAPDLVQNQ